MDNQKNWIESKARERSSLNFVKTILELSGYKVMEFGIEKHDQEIIKEIKSNYSSKTNRRLLSMPDYIVVDNDTKESWIIEVKHRAFKDTFKMKEDNLAFRYGNIKDYLDFWSEAILVITMNVSPYCLCVDLDKVNWNYHFKKKFDNGKGGQDEEWSFNGLYKVINDRFPKVTQDNFRRALEISGIETKK